jgi:hypothetical protein
MEKTFVRRDVWSLRADDPWDPVTLAYARAVNVMMSRPVSDPTSWSYQAAIHASHVAPPPGAKWNECQHQSWYFLPWHRMYLYYFERILRAAVAQTGGPEDFALPYWNYDNPFPNSTLPQPFREPTLPDGSSNPLFLPPPRRDTDIANGAQLNPLVTSSSAAMAMTGFSGPPGSGFGGGRRTPAHFGGSVGGLEGTPHNDIHVQVGGSPSGQCQGGLMIDPRCAALDPIFWLHHANVDRLWSQWLALGGGRANPTDPAWLSQSFTFRDETGATVTLTGAEVVDSAADLHYVYDDQVTEEGVAVSLSAEPPARPERPMPPEPAAATEQTVVLAGRPVSVDLVVAPEAVPSLAGAPGAEAAMYLNVEDIEADRNQGIVYGVFVNLPQDDPDADVRRYHVGNISLFGIEAMRDADEAHEGVPGFRHTYDITPVVAALTAEGRWDPRSITVTFEPITPIPAPGQEGLAGVAGPDLAEAAAAPIRIGRVSLFVA